jgi:hypothetical protein
MHQWEAENREFPAWQLRDAKKQRLKPQLFRRL